MGIGESIARGVGRQYYNMYHAFDFSSMSNIFAGGDPDSSIGKITNSLNNLSSSISDVMQPIALAIAVLFFFISLFEFAMSDRLTIESFVKFFAKLAIAIACIFLCNDLTSGIEQFGTAFSNLIVDSANFGTELNSSGLALSDDVTVWEDAVLKGIGNEKWHVGGGSVSIGTALGMLLESIVPSLIMMVVGIVVGAVLIIISFSRFLEMALRAAFMPIAIALISDDGWRGAAGRYIRKFVAICAQGAILTVLMKILQGGIPICFGWEITSEGLSFGSTNVFISITYVIGFAIAVISLMFKSIGVVNDVFGA